MKNIYYLVIASILSLSTGAHAIEVEGDYIETNQITWLKDKRAPLKAITSPKQRGPKKQSAQPQTISMSSVVTTNNWVDLNLTIDAPAREQWFGYTPGSLTLPGWMYEGYTYSLVLDGGYSGGVADISRVELIMCVNYGDPLQHCKYMRDESDDFSVQHDAVSFSGFPVVTPSSQIVYFIRVLEHIGSYQPYPYPTPVEVIISSKLYVQ